MFLRQQSPLRLALYCLMKVKRTGQFVNERSHKSRGSRFDHHLGVGVNRLTVLVLVGRGDEYGDAISSVNARCVRASSRRWPLSVTIVGIVGRNSLSSVCTSTLLSLSLILDIALTRCEARRHRVFIHPHSDYLNLDTAGDRSRPRCLGASGSQRKAHRPQPRERARRPRAAAPDDTHTPRFLSNSCCPSWVGTAP